ncbi:thioether cross-link-forming SCIFF peptide maturase [Clostridium folliculivorans]|uniref:Thioether cross-link-forming SCIFF peptide maturase n=1 Tax=Clostridium folliculivorans TaxID=2886038 RepID=A0A9W5XZH8_9CLOT|nr:thioether cross-link-forming SCIFF peptide maturase [Clostridium folliculivorans]GKU23848.1 thioether cross-link-forming SCIFF peptide maturase [Clostridium folliculivorans]GKU29964.1 thioether cross-link-forming SCIFF peptide maturase [Clostridium folliculivorans]
MALIHKFTKGNEYYVIDVNSGSVHIVDKLIYDLIDDEKLRDREQLINDFSGIYTKEEIEEAFYDINELIEEGMLYSEDLYEDIAMSDRDDSYIKALCLNVVHDCNLRCKYCFADEGEYKGCRKPMSAETGKKAIDWVIKKSGPRRNIEVDLFGGEPLMVFDTIKEIVDYARVQEKIHKKNIRFTMTTNATLLNDEIMEYIDKNMGNIILSIDGRKNINDAVRVRVDGSGSYDRILPRIKQMVDKRDKSKQYYARGTFTRNNTDFFEDVMALANEGFKEISIEPVVLPDEHELSLRREDLPVIFDQYDKLYDEMVKRYKEGKDQFTFYHFNIDLNGGPCVYKRISGCGAGHEYVAITPDGEIYPCHQFVGNKDFLIGNLDTLEIDSDLEQEFKTAHIYNKPKCKECWARFYCSGGCQANNFNFNGDIHVPYEIGCEMQKKRIECAIALKAVTME